MQFLHFNGHSLYYTVDTANSYFLSETVMLIHSNFSDHSIFDLLVPFLTKKYNVIRYDLAGIRAKHPRKLRKLILTPM
ncbi:alpha/beta fold hydrolase [Heyndrickxia acidicola]|uniref:Uncharacterized protein n=1 Tax=Heyndrickxia acidicola TaxID=209389 RepID=A0ABU6MMI8_9BACI|nr:hypothetical protein [Heyndrickxia acidicola]MED1205514.1 hypothetical protein [Heyndrickxia acidicola]